MGNEVFETQKDQGRLEDAWNFPRVVLVDTVSFCNLKCSMCVHKEMTRKRGIMPWNLFRRIIDDVAEADNTVRVWMVFFGEALILRRKKPSIFDMIYYAKGKGLKDVVLNSNANLLDKGAARRIIESGLDAIYIGIDAFSPETYMKIRVGGSYGKVVDNTLHLLELKRELDAEKPEVFVQFVEMDVNRAEKEDFIEFWKKAGAGVKIRPKVSWAGQIEAPNLVMDEKDRWPCYWAMRTLSITDTGKVVTCAVDLDAKFVAGDVNHQSLREIWNGKLKKLRQLHQSRQFEALPENCKQCKDWQAARADYYWMNP